MSKLFSTVFGLLLLFYFSTVVGFTIIPALMIGFVGFKTFYQLSK